MTLNNFAEHIKRAFREHYEATASEPDGIQWMMSRDEECDYVWDREGQLVLDIIQDEAEVEYDIAKDVHEILDDGHFRHHHDDPGEREFDCEIQYKKKRQYSSRWHGHWSDLQSELKTRTRFFSQNALSLFETVFTDLSTMATNNGQPVLKMCGPGTDLVELYRARAFQSEERLQEALENPARLLGPPASVNATAGRMNAQGISVFYGSTSASVAIAEVRPPVGSKVAVAKFAIQKVLTLLDLTALRFVEVQGSVFDPRFVGLIEQAVFLKSFCASITIPVMPDFQTFEYLITQATADYLATDKRLSLDGIIYPSAQTLDDEINVVLFHKSARATAFPDNPTYKVELYTYEEDGECFDCRMKLQTPVSSSDRDSGFDYDGREQVLVLDDRSIAVCEITAVSYKSHNHSVRVDVS